MIAALHLEYLVYLIIICISSKSVYAQSCGPKVKPRFLVGIPCDMSRSTFCTAAGNAYPWNSLRRYIYENQGLMRRMYGDERHSVILHSDLQTRSYTSWSSEKIRTGRVSPSLNKDSLPVPDDILPDRYRRGNSSIRSSKTTIKPQTKTKELPSTQNLTDIKVSATSTPSTRTSTSQIVETVETVTETVPTTVDQTTEDDGYQYPGTASLLESEYDEDYETVSTSLPQTSTTSLKPTTAEPPGLQDVITGQPSSMVEDRVYYNTQTVEESHVLSSNSVEEKNGVKQEVTDTDKKEDEKESPKGFNACPVKEEVVAPYWANNTRNEILALLNVYPFEQYIHWEKCAYENHQMFCRDGCRCEQQFRLHRLLAFDPRNECRGIFADWFRFPSCCVCVCYNLTDTVPKA